MAIDQISVVSRPAAADGVLVVDVSNLAHRSAHAYEDLKTPDGRRSGHVFGSVRLLLSTLANDLPPGRWCLALCYDGPGAKAARQQVVPEYKAHRREDRFDPMPDATKVVRAVPGLHLMEPGHEGDDAICWVAERCSTKQVVVLTGDRDLWALLRFPHVRVLSPNLKRYVTPADVEENYLVTDPARIPLAKAVFGDGSDGLKGVHGLQSKTSKQRPHVAPLLNAPALARTDRVVETFYAVGEDTWQLHMAPKTWTSLVASRAQVEANYRVILARTAGFGKQSARVVAQGAAERARLKNHLYDFECRRLVTMLGPLFP